MFREFTQDFYKIRKARSLRWCIIVCAIICFVEAIVSNVLHGSMVVSVMLSVNQHFIHVYSTILFSILLCQKDYQNDYINNVMVSVNKVKYYLSKFAYIVLFALIMYALTFLGEIIGNYSFGDKLFCDIPNDNGQDFYTTEEYVYASLLFFFTDITLGMFAMMMVYLLRNSIIATALSFGYVFVINGLICMAINAIVGNNFLFEYYTPVWILDSVGHPSFFAKFSPVPYNRMECFAIILAYFVGFFTIGLLAVYKRKKY